MSTLLSVCCAETLRHDVVTGIDWSIEAARGPVHEHGADSDTDGTAVTDDSDVERHASDRLTAYVTSRYVQPLHFYCHYLSLNTQVILLCNSHQRWAVHTLKFVELIVQ